jgi:hypothetical protein
MALWVSTVATNQVEYRPDHGEQIMPHWRTPRRLRAARVVRGSINSAR